MDIFDDVNSAPEAQIAWRLGLEQAKDGKSYVCPICEHGRGGDGIRQKEFKGKLTWHCYGRCGSHWTSNANFIAAVEGIDPDDTAELAKRLSELFPEYSNSNFFFSGDKKSKQKNPPAAGSEMKMSEQKNPAGEPEPRNFSKLYELCRKNYSLKKFVDKCGGAWRSLTYETLDEAGCMYNPEYMIAEGFKRPCLLVPYDDELFYFRRVDEVPEGEEKCGVPKKVKRKLYVAEPISLKLPNIIVESELDALSVKQVLGKSDIGIIATGSAGFVQMTVGELEKKFGGYDKKPSFIIMFDNDGTGKEKGELLAKELRSLGYPAELSFFGEHMSGTYDISDSSGNTKRITYPKVDANDLLQKGKAELFGRLIDVLDQTEWKLQDQYEAMQTAKAKALEAERIAAMEKSGMKIFSFTEYFAADFFRDIELTAKYSSRKTGFENIDEAQIFMPGLYVLGALPASGKTTFAWQLLNQLAGNGEPCIYCSYEMSKTELFTKSIVRELYKDNPRLSERLNLTSVNIRRGACRGSKELVTQAAAFTKSGTNLRVIESSNMSITELIEGLKPFVVGVDKPPTVCVDYLQIIPSKSSKLSSAKEKIDDVILRLKDFQRETNSTLLIISSFNRENYWEEVSFKAFKESGAIEYSADSIWALQNYGVDDNGRTDKEEMIKMSRERVRKVKFSCLKNRNGSAYDCMFRYYAAYDYFEPLKEENETRPKIGH
ncbi:MAG: toprim domain-containing protein [Selenomonadaceae bacterium]|nr:toprim domain-containing protein [Selenomonadaceae bacterium]